MCLIVNRKLCPNGYKIAKKNIPCYKVLLKTYSGRFETPYIKQPVDIKTGIEADYFQTQPRNEIRIDKGVHSCTNLNRARTLQYLYINTIDIYSYYGIQILKAYIPKGAKYWVGKCHEFCSEKIVFAEK